MAEGKVILEKGRFDLTLRRLAYELIENHSDFANSVILGIQPRGTIVSDRILEILKEEVPDLNPGYGKLDITFFRDDFRIREEPLRASSTELDISLEDKRLILIDDVLYTGRTIHAAMAAVQQFGRPAEIDLLVLVDRRFNRHFPIKADYIGITVDSVDEAYVKVLWSDDHKSDSINIYPSKNG